MVISKLTVLSNEYFVEYLLFSIYYFVICTSLSQFAAADLLVRNSDIYLNLNLMYYQLINDKIEKYTVCKLNEHHDLRHDESS